MSDTQAAILLALRLKDVNLMQTAAAKRGRSVEAAEETRRMVMQASVSDSKRLELEEL
ncbi:MAG: hypothetical protein ACRCYZ_04145 [Alphaproteobacteria bacterium]